MRTRTFRRLALAAAVVVGATAIGVAISAGGGGPNQAEAADHLDAPGLTPPGGDTRLDLTDIYAFRPRSGRTALVMNVNGFSKPGDQATFASGIPTVAATKRVSYNFRIDNNGDAREDVVLRVTFGNPNKHGVQSFQVRRNGRLLVARARSASGRRRTWAARRSTGWGGPRSPRCSSRTIRSSPSAPSRR